MTEVALEVALRVGLEAPRDGARLLGARRVGAVAAAEALALDLRAAERTALLAVAGLRGAAVGEGDIALAIGFGVAVELQSLQ